MVEPSGKILITGALGYVGGRIATYLQEAAPNLSLRLMARDTRKELPDWAKPLDVVRADVLDNAS